MRGKEVRNFKAEGAVDANSQQDVIRPGKFFFSNEKERKRKRKR